MIRKLTKKTVSHFTKPMKSVILLLVKWKNRESDERIQPNRI